MSRSLEPGSEAGGAQLPGRGSIRLAGYELGTAVLTRFRLDGGAMFGSVPKSLWERQAPADSRNRIGLVARVLVVKGAGSLVLVDAGVGDKFGAREREHFAVDEVPESSLPFRWDSVTDLVLTHLHFDHSGGATVWDSIPTTPLESRTARLRVPDARVYLGEENWLRARSPGVRERASYLSENVAPLERADLRLVKGTAEVLPGIHVFPSHGHTRGLQWVLIGDGPGAVAFPADLVPTSAHVHLPFVMGYDMCVETLLAEKQSFLNRAVEEEWIVVFAHDEKVPAARIVRGKDGRFQVGEIFEI